MKVGVISDTHLTEPSRELEELVRTVFADTELILHAGDIVELDVLEAFKDKEVVAVWGNMDSPHTKKSLPEQVILDLKGFRIGLIHGWGAPMGMEKKLLPRFDRVDAIVFGHTHMKTNRTRDGILWFNPGAFAGGWSAMGRRSVGLLTIGETLTGEHVSL